MTYDDLMQLVARSTEDEWVRTELAERVVAVHRDDLQVRLELDTSEENEREFAEDWTDRFPSKKAIRQLCYLFYGSSLVHDFVVVAVDDFRASLPLPVVGTSDVPRIKYAVAAAVNLGSRFDEYFRRAGFEVVD